MTGLELIYKLLELKFSLRRPIVLSSCHCDDHLASGEVKIINNSYFGKAIRID